LESFQQRRPDFSASRVYASRRVRTDQQGEKQIAMRRTITTTAAAVIALAAAAPAIADNAVCTVADPTGTPLNIRLEPNGQTVARVRNGEKLLVFLDGTKTDSRGRIWYEVAMSTSAAPDGYVFAEYVRCP
jgi:hypothetical protein